MSQKKCPKCGEMNPPEAVMCWACYTPLSGAAPAGPASSAPSSPAAKDDAPSQKKPIPPWQIGVIVVGFLMGGFFGIKSLTGGEEDVSLIETSIPPTQPSNPTEVTVPGGNPPPPAPPPPPPGPVADPQPPDNPAERQFSVVAPPNMGYTVGTMGIVVNNPNLSVEEAAGIAAGVRKTMTRNKDWAVLQIYVFADQASGDAFRAHQEQRKGAPLGAADMQALQPIWQKTIIRYEYNRGQHGYLIPRGNPSSWWQGKPKYSKAR